MGIRFTLLVPDRARNSEGGYPVYKQILGGDVKLRDFAGPTLAPYLTLGEDGTGDVTDLEGFYQAVDQVTDGYYLSSLDDGNFSYWNHLYDLAKVALAFQEHGVHAKVCLC